MTASVKRILQVAMELPPDERADVAARLIASLQAGQSATAADAWEAEIGRRINELDSGVVKPISMTQFWKIVEENPDATRKAQGASRRGKGGARGVSVVSRTKSRRRKTIRN